MLHVRPAGRRISASSSTAAWPHCSGSARRESSVDDLRDVLGRYHDEPFRSFGPVEWAVAPADDPRRCRGRRERMGAVRLASEVDARLELRGILRRAAAICEHDDGRAAEHVAAPQLESAIAD